MGIGKEKQIVMLVDDEAANIKILAEGLRNDYEIVVAINGDDAISRAGSAPLPDLILLDIVMPGKDGYSVCRTIKNSAETKNIPVIFITAKDDDEDERRGLDSGAVDYIKKPFNIAIVQARVKTHLELKRHRDFIEFLLEQKYLNLEEAQKEYMTLFLLGGI